MSNRSSVRYRQDGCKISSNRILFKSQMSGFHGKVRKGSPPVYGQQCFFCNATSAMLVRQSTSPEWRGISRLFAPLWEVLAAKLRENFPREGTECTYVVPTIGFLAQVLNVYDRRYGIGIPVFRSSPVEDNHVYCISLGVSLCALVCPSTFCNKLLVKRVFRPKIPCRMGDGRSSASSLSRRMASLGDLSFCGALLLWPLQAAIYLFFHKVKYRTFTCDTTGEPVKLSVTVHSAPHPVSLVPPIGLGEAKPFW